MQIFDLKPSHHRYQNTRPKNYKNGSRSKSVQYYKTHDETGQVEIYHDLEWLTILRLTNSLLKTTPYSCYMPGSQGSSGERFNFTLTKEELSETLKLMDYNVRISRDDFHPMVPAYNPVSDRWKMRNISAVPIPKPLLNPYTSPSASRSG